MRVSLLPLLALAALRHNAFSAPGTGVTHSDARRAEKVVEQELQRYRTIVENTHGGVWETDAEGTTTYVNDRTAELLGRPREEILGRTLTDFLDGEAAAAYRRRLPGRRQGVSEQFETTVTRSDGTQLPVLMAVNALVDEHGRFIGSLAMLNDISRWHSDGPPSTE